MKAQPWIRIWNRQTIMMDTSPDTMVTLHGNIYDVDCGQGRGWSLNDIDGVIMLNTGLKRDEEHWFYELDMVVCEDQIGIVIMSAGNAVVWFREGDTDWLEDIGVEYTGHYFDALWNGHPGGAYREVAESFPLTKYFGE